MSVTGVQSSLQLIDLLLLHKYARRLRSTAGNVRGEERSGMEPKQESQRRAAIPEQRDGVLFVAARSWDKAAEQITVVGLTTRRSHTAQSSLKPAD